MKVKESYWREASKTDKNDKPNWRDDTTTARRGQTLTEQTNAANKARQSNSPLKDDAKFANLLESPAKLQKPGQRQEDSGEQRRDDQKKDKKHHAAEKDSLDLNRANDGKTEKYESSGGQTGGGGGQGGFGAGVNQLNLSENFAARSILHVADLERLISTVRSQIKLNGRREVVLQLNRSVLEGLRVKITTDPTAAKGVQIEFLAANETVRSQIANHAPELAEILRGRGINLGSLSTSLGSNDTNQDFSDETDALKLKSLSGEKADSFAENTFDAPPADDNIYQA